MVHAYKGRPRSYLAEAPPVPIDIRRSSKSEGGKLSVYVVEEQEIFRDAYSAFFAEHEDIEIVSVDTSYDANVLPELIASSRPDVLLIGVKVLSASVVEQLEAVQRACQDTALVLLAAAYEGDGLRALREFARKSRNGYAYLLKHMVDTPDELESVITAVSEGRVVLDPAGMAGMVVPSTIEEDRVQRLSPRELEVLGIMAKGYRNSAVAQMLGLENKTIDRHINSIYSKLDEGLNTLHPRVAAIILYMRAMGQLAPEESEE